MYNMYIYIHSRAKTNIILCIKQDKTLNKPSLYDTTHTMNFAPPAHPKKIKKQDNMCPSRFIQQYHSAMRRCYTKSSKTPKQDIQCYYPLSYAATRICVRVCASVCARECVRVRVRVVLSSIPEHGRSTAGC